MTGVWMRGGWGHTQGENTALFCFPLACQALCFVCWIMFNSSSWLQFSSVLGKEQKLSSPILLFTFKRGKYFFKNLLKCKGLVTMKVPLNLWCS